MYQHTMALNYAPSSSGTSISNTNNDRGHGQPHGFGLATPLPGQFGGPRLRVELLEIQHALLGRKYARVDRRPLDPPPVVWLRIFQVFNEGTPQQVEKEIEQYDQVQTLGYVCTLDLFPIRGGPRDHPRDARDFTDRGLSAQFYETHTPYESSVPVHHIPRTVDYTPYGGSFRIQDSHHSFDSSPARFASPSEEVLCMYDDFAVYEKDKLTEALVGQQHVQPACIDYQGKKALMFVFADIAVKIEGTFILRYRVFDICARASSGRHPSQAECYGQPFRVYSTKEFPGLQPSTDLTKLLARWGVRLNIRETERRRRKKSDGMIDSAAAFAAESSNGKRRRRKRKIDDSDDQIDDNND